LVCSELKFNTATLQHAGVPIWLWWLAGSQIIYAFIMMPHTLPQSYVRWIRKQGAKELYVWQGVRVSGLAAALCQLFRAAPLSWLYLCRNRVHTPACAGC
jgi:hypothetical protein